MLCCNGVSFLLSAFCDSWQLGALLCKLETLPVPTVAVLNGTTLGGGLELALACDYRVADSACSQIGLPEVKLGVLPGELKEEVEDVKSSLYCSSCLPGAGGCCRLPRLIGFPRSLPLLVTGKTVTAKEALRIGLVDMLWTQTETEIQNGPSYAWRNELMSCIETGAIGRKRLPIQKRVLKDEVAMPELTSPTTEELEAMLEFSWRDCEEKARKKYGPLPGKLSVAALFSHCLHWFLYVFTFIQLWWKLGWTMPAPFICLETSWKCYYAGSWFESLSVNLLGFVRLATLPETKNVMNLFLISRQLKKQALQFGVESGGQNMAVDINNSTVLVVVGREGMKYSSAFIQGLLYTGLNVMVMLMRGPGAPLKEEVRSLFQYAVKRGHMTAEEVDRRLREKLSFVDHELQLEKPTAHCIVVNMMFEGWEKEKEELRKLKRDLYQIYKVTLHGKYIAI